MLFYRGSTSVSFVPSVYIIVGLSVTLFAQFLCIFNCLHRNSAREVRCNCKEYQNDFSLPKECGLQNELGTAGLYCNRKN